MDSTIELVETRIVDLPTRRLQQFARLGAYRQSVIIIRIVTRNGIEGHGEATVPGGPWWSGDSVEAMKATLDQYLVPEVLGEPVEEVSRLMNKAHARVRNNAFIKAGLEMALLDCTGRLFQVPLHVLLGGQIRRHLPVAWPLATGDINQEIEEAGQMIDSGKARAFKIKMGALPFKADLDRALAICKALAGVASVRVDPNESWDEVTTLRALGPLEDAGVEIVEQPVPRWNLDAMARLQRETRSVILIDEGVQSVHDMIEVVKRAAAGLVSLKIMKSGGIRASRAMADIAAAAGLPVYMGTFLETSLGTAANMQLAASLDALPFGGEVIGPLLLAEDLCTQPACYHDHALWLQDGPGLGVAVDPARLSAFGRGQPFQAWASDSIRREAAAAKPGLGPTGAVPPGRAENTPDGETTRRQRA